MYVSFRHVHYSTYISSNMVIYIGIGIEKMIGYNEQIIVVSMNNGGLGVKITL